MTSKFLFAAPVLALVLAGCGAYGDVAVPSEGPGTAPEVKTVPTLAVADSAFGKILVDAEGSTLYAFTQDSDGVSVCYNECAASWPALIGEIGLRAGEGVVPSLLGIAVRTDGTEQVTYAGMPLYYFAGDARPADTNGQGVGEVWFVVSPVGDIIESSFPRGGYGYRASS